MKNEIMKRIAMTITALNNVSVSGKQNLANLSGSIAVLEEVMSDLQTVDFCENTEDKKKDSK